MEPVILNNKQFVQSFKDVPRLAINLLIKNPEGKILLTKRAIPPQKGYWHYPGSFLRKNEKIKDCINRIAQKELGIKIVNSKTKLLGVFENTNKDPRGHVIDIVYEYKIHKNFQFTPNKETSQATFFSKLPLKIGFNHRRVLNRLRKSHTGSGI